ncbi:MAG: hypothetical protein JWR65_3067 [Massilia sp.]|nr:hypothetical protein [Massilia sp.]
MSTNASHPVHGGSLFAGLAKFVQPPSMAANTKAKPAADIGPAARPGGKPLLQLYLMSSGLNSVRPELLAERIVHD